MGNGPVAQKDCPAHIISCLFVDGLFLSLNSKSHGTKTVPGTKNMLDKVNEWVTSGQVGR